MDQDYLVKRAHIEGRGGFDVWDVRFERDNDGFKKVDRWSWQENPFLGTRELDGLKVSNPPNAAHIAFNGVLPGFSVSGIS